MRLAGLATSGLGSVHLGRCHRRPAVRPRARRGHVPGQLGQAQVAQAHARHTHDLLVGDLPAAGHGEYRCWCLLQRE